MAKQKVIESKQFSLQWRDLLRGGIIAAISPVFTILIQSLQAEDLIVSWKSILNVAIIAFLTYLSKNLLEPTKIIVPTSSVESAEVAKTIKKEL